MRIPSTFISWHKESVQYCQEPCISNQLILKHGVVYRDTPLVTVFGIEVFRVTVFGIGIPNTITAYFS